MTIAVTDTGDLRRLVRHVPPNQRVCENPPDGYEYDTWGDIWFPFDSGGEYRDKHKEYKPEVEQAIALCHVCPARDACLEAALSEEGRQPIRDRNGVYGAADPKDRRDIAAERARLRRDGTRPKNKYAAPTEDAGPLRERMNAYVGAGSGPQFDALIGDDLGISAETISIIRTGRRERVRPSTYRAIMQWFADRP